MPSVNHCKLVLKISITELKTIPRVLISVRHLYINKFSLLFKKKQTKKTKLDTNLNLDSYPKWDEEKMNTY